VPANAEREGLEEMINLSTRGRYATRILVNLARVPEGTAKSARKIAQEEGITADYVEQLLIKLKTSGYIRSKRGKQGGAMLARRPENICIAELLQVIEGEMSIVPCITQDCERKRDCPTRSLWKEANNALVRVFRESSVADLVREQTSRTVNYQI
jgi:Rrf2 family protein